MTAVCNVPTCFIQNECLLSSFMLLHKATTMFNILTETSTSFETTWISRYGATYWELYTAQNHTRITTCTLARIWDSGYPKLLPENKNSMQSTTINQEYLFSVSKSYDSCPHIWTCAEALFSSRNPRDTVTRRKSLINTPCSAENISSEAVIHPVDCY